MSGTGFIEAATSNSLNAVVGSLTDAAIITDIAGSINGKLRGLVVLALEAAAKIGAVTDPGVTTDANGSLSAKLRGLIILTIAQSAKLPASLGIKAAAASLSVTQATEDAARFPASLGSKADAASLPVTQSTEDKAVLSGMSGKLPASLGIKAAAASLSVVQATEDAARFPASLGSKADAAAFPITMSTEDKAKIPALGVAASAAASPVVLASDDAQLAKLTDGIFFDGSTAGGSRSFDGAQKTGALAAGRYVVSADQTCHVMTGPNASVAATVGGCTRVPADTVVGFVIDGTNDAFGAIKETTAGTLYYTKVG